MDYLDPIAMSSSALVVGLLFVVGGLYARRNGRLHTRQGAAVLAGFAAVMGVVSMSAGMLTLVRAV